MSFAGTRAERNGRFVLALAGAMAVVAVILGLRNLWFLYNAVGVAGTVVANRRVEVQTKGGPSVTFRPTVRFSDSRGAAHEFEESSGDRTALPVGMRLPVLYPPDDPASARVGGPALWMLPSGLILMAVFFGLIGGCLLITGRSVNRWQIRRACAVATGDKRLVQPGLSVRT